MSNKKPFRTSIGGQALIEGVMMRGPSSTYLAVRTPKGEIEGEYVTAASPAQKYKFLKWPLIRGITGFIQSMMVGYKCLMISAEKSGMEDLEDEQPSKFEQKIMDLFGDKLMKVVSTIGVVLGVALAVVLFMLLPTLLFNGVKHFAGEEINIYRALFEGVIKIAIFVAYLALVAQMKELRRVFEYHGAEHKTIFCYESGEALTVENVRTKKRFHPRCGTSFMIVMMIVGIIVSFVISYFTKADRLWYVWVPIKILVVPLIMGLGYEVIKLCGKYDNLFTRIISAPGMWMQRLTTREPDDSQIEVAIAALKGVLPDDPNDAVCCGEPPVMEPEEGPQPEQEENDLQADL